MTRGSYFSGSKAAGVLFAATALFFWQLRNPAIRFSSTLANDVLGFALAIGLPHGLLSYRSYGLGGGRKYLPLLPAFRYCSTQALSFSASSCLVASTDLQKRRGRDLKWPYI